MRIRTPFLDRGLMDRGEVDSGPDLTLEENPAQTLVKINQLPLRNGADLEPCVTPNWNRTQKNRIIIRETAKKAIFFKYHPSSLVAI